MVLYIFNKSLHTTTVCVLIFSLTKCGMLLSMSGKLCLRQFFRIHALLYMCIVHVCSVYQREREREIILLRSIVNMMIHVQIKFTMSIDPSRPALRPWRSLAHRPP